MSAETNNDLELHSKTGSYHIHRTLVSLDYVLALSCLLYIWPQSRWGKSCHSTSLCPVCRVGTAWKFQAPGRIHILTPPQRLKHRAKQSVRFYILRIVILCCGECTLFRSYTSNILMTCYSPSAAPAALYYTLLVVKGFLFSVAAKVTNTPLIPQNALVFYLCE